ncbi:MAG TPA: methionyl-tRNA formyltransferase [Verrucomicrobiae bacterium]|nr:methionyl-tRNA formyltransferase [Verrucomicrobiae bacterium]
MNLIFAGTPDFAVPALDALVGAGHRVLAAYTQPDRPAGRGRVLTPTPVALRAAQLGIEVRKPVKLVPEECVALAALRADAMVVVAYGLLLPQAALDSTRLGCFNIHASLLPRWRGAAPIARAVLAGDAESGVTIMRMELGLDTGPMLVVGRVPIGAQTTAGELHDALSPLGARLMVEALAQLASGRASETPQPVEGVTYAKKITKDEARLDWSLPAQELARRVRGYNPQPVAWTELGSERVRILHAVAASGGGEAPGTIVGVDATGIHVATGYGTLVVTQIQFPGGKAMGAAQAAAGRSLPGLIFLSP